MALLVDDWKIYCFSEERILNLRSDGQVWLRRNDGKPFRKDFTKSVSKNRHSVHIWGCIPPLGTLLFFKAPEKCNARNICVVQKAGVQNVGICRPGFIDGKCLIHRAGIVNGWKVDIEIFDNEILHRAAHSLNINPIEGYTAAVSVLGTDCH